MSSSSGAEQFLTSPTEQQENDSESMAMDAKLLVATASGGVQQLKDMVKEEESQMMVVMMAKQAAPVKKYRHGNMDPHLLALASSGSYKELQILLNRESYGDTEANASILAGKTAEGDTALHVVAACGEGDNFFTRFKDLRELLTQLDNSNKNNKRRWWHWGLTRAECRALTTYGDGDDFLESARIIYGKVKDLLFEENNEGNTPLHCAARAGKSKMVACLIDLAFTEGEDRMKALLRKENKHKETALHEAVCIGNNKIVNLLMDKDSELASFPQDGGASPMYRAIMLQRDEIVKTLYDKSSHGMLSFSGPNGRNALHVAVLRYQAPDLTKLLEWNKTHMCPENKDLTTQRDENGCTPLHFAAARKKPSSICRQVLKANPDALYQPDHAGLFPIHVAASVGSFENVDMFVTEFPGSAGLRDAKGRTFLHVAVEKDNENIISGACRNLSLSRIMNMVDNDGNTALHLAVEAGRLQMFCPLLGNPQVNLNLPNRRGETPLDIAHYKLPENGFFIIQWQSIEAQIYLALTHVGAVIGVCHQDHFKDSITLRVKKSKEMVVLKESTGALCIGSVLIATVTFGATFAVPGGYIDDGHDNQGTPILARRYAFQGFVWSNAFAFMCSTVAIVALMRSGDPLFNLWSRKGNLGVAFYFVSISITCLAAAFALAAYVVLSPVAHGTAVFISFVTFIVLLFNHQVEFISARVRLLKPLYTRKGLIRACAVSARALMGAMLFHYWPLIYIFGMVTLQYLSFKREAPAPALAPAPAPALAST